MQRTYYTVTLKPFDIVNDVNNVNVQKYFKKVEFKIIKKKWLGPLGNEICWMNTAQKSMKFLTSFLTMHASNRLITIP